jgi:hypothetical protein
MISVKHSLLLLVLAASLAAVSAEARVYRESELAPLVDQPIPADSELVGTFIYLGDSGGFKAFSSFTETEGKITFGKILIVVSFPNGAPPNLTVGKVIRPDEKDPLLIQSVKRSSDGAFIYVRLIYSGKT